jgi:hypothetical protein
LSIFQDLKIIGVKMATHDQIEKARQFKLPDNFYLYEQKEECQGCRGCKEE